jgi:hypothetical protein
MLLLLQWLHFCRASLAGLMVPVDVEGALGEILSLAATWA